jgi:hypothetical protein
METETSNRGSEVSKGDTMRIAAAIMLWISIVVLAGCSDRGRLYGNIYEGIKAREANVHPSLEREPVEQNMSYPEYEAERQRLRENDGRT